MLSRHLHSLAWALLIGTLVVILSGAAQLGAPAGEPHRGLSGLVVLLALALAVASWGQSKLRRLALGGVAFAVGLGGLGILMTASPWLVVLHACLSHVFFAVTAALLVATSPERRRSVEMIADTGSPSLRTLGLVVPAAVMLQIFLGAIYRHLGLPVWPHLVGSLLVGCLLLYTGMVVLEADAPHPVLRKTAQVLLAITVAQLAFGLGAFLGRVMVSDGLPPEWWSVLARTLHVATGAMTLGASVAYAMQVNYHR